jgi:hypothetical protein
MPGQIGPDYSNMFDQAMPYSEYGQTGIDPGYTALAMSLGYQPDPMAPAGTEGIAQMRFLATLKNLMDQEMGGPNGRAASISQGNPIMGLPFAARQYAGLGQALMNSQQGHALLPGSQRAMFQNGYQFGPINPSASDPNAIMQLYAAARGSNQLPGGTPAGPAQGTPALPPPANQQAAANSAGQLNRGMTSSQVSGMPGDVGNQGAGGSPGPGAYTSNSANSDIIRGLMQSAPQQSSQVGSVPGTGISISQDPNGLAGMIQSLPPDRKAMVLGILHALMSNAGGG